jgi:hypothetical protein
MLDSRRLGHALIGHRAAPASARHDYVVEPADKEDVRSLMIGIMNVDAKLDTVIYLLEEDDDEEEEEDETDS